MHTTSSTDARPATVLVAGAGGHLGRRVVELLHAQGYPGLVAATRHPEKLTAFRNAGLDVRRVDFNEPATLAPALAGIDRLLLISTDELSTLGLRIRQHLAAIEAAKAAGVGHIVYTSMPHPEPGSVIPFAPDHYATEQALRQSGLGYTILRVSWYADNLLGFLPQLLAAGKWFTAAGEGRIAYIPREDVARATAAALVAPAPPSTTYDLTGPQALSVAEMADLAADVFRQPLDVVYLSEQVLTQKLTELGIPAPPAMVVVTDTNTRLGKFDLVTDAVAQLTGQPPQSLRTFFEQAVSGFVQSGSH
ncbi:SDR family oxidoreductase [Hymenobacter daeguensis]